MNRTVSVRITGRVQGVGFRDWTRATAIGLGLSGWVRNEPDGAVAALFQGDREAIGRMLTACHEGPGSAAVSQVIAEDAAPDALDGFRVDG